MLVSRPVRLIGSSTGMEDEGFTTEVSGGLRVSVSGGALAIRKVQ